MYRNIKCLVDRAASTEVEQNRLSSNPVRLNHVIPTESVNWSVSTHPVDSRSITNELNNPSVKLLKRQF